MQLRSTVSAWTTSKITVAAGGVYSCAVLVNNIIHFIIVKSYCTDRNDHTTVTAPLPVCSAKLSTVGPG